MKNLLIILLIVVAFGCAKQPIYVTKSDTVKQKTVVFVPRDSIIRIPGDSSMISYLVECRGQNAYLTQILSQQTGKHTDLPIVTLKNNVLRSECKVDSFAVYAKLKDRYETDVTNIKQVIVPPPVKFVPKFIKFLAWSGGALYILLILFIAGWILKKYTQLKIPFLK